MISEVRDLYWLEDARPSSGALGQHQEAQRSQGVLQLSAPVGQITQKLAGDLVSPLRLRKQLLGQGDLRYVGGGLTNLRQIMWLVK
jgi:hypothetical protein